MAFTIEEIEKAFSTPVHQIFHYTSTDVKLNVNYPIIIDYLTGKSNSILGITYDSNNLAFIPIINLLTSLETLSSNDLLVLDIINDQTMSPFLKYNFNHWLLQNLYSNESDNAFDNAIRLLQNQGNNIDAIFQFFIHTTPPADIDNMLMKHMPLTNFLFAYVKASKIITQPTNPYNWHNQWSIFYFKLLEKVKPELAIDYILYGLSTSQSPVAFFINYQQGKYLQEIVSHLTNLQNPNRDVISKKFINAITLYENDQIQFESLVVQLSQQYLNHIRIHSLKYIHESTGSIKAFANKDQLFPFYPLSTCAFHFLLSYQPTEAITSIELFFEQKIFIHQQTLLVLQYHLGDDAFTYFQKALTITNSPAGINYYQDLLSATTKLFSPALYLPLVWSFVNTKSKPIKQLIANIVAANDAAFEDKAIALLQHKNGETRQTAASILSYSNSAKAIDAVMQILHTETNETVRDILLQTVVEVLPKKATQDFVVEMINAANKRGKLDKPIETWLDEASHPPLLYKDGTTLNTSTVRFLLYRMSRVKTMCSDIEAKYIIDQIDKEKSTDFALHLIQLFRDKEAKAELKWMMALSAMLGNETVVDKIRITTNSWIEENRFKMAEYGVGALALQGSDKALRWVEWYSRKYRSKKANVGAAALVALENAAIELGISTHELGDKIVPDFGFDGLFKTFEIDGQEYRAFIDSKFKIAFFNEDNKQLKALPTNANSTLKDEFKTIAKEVKDIVKSQSPRLEYYLIIQRKWTTEQWQQFFLNNPIMFIYATKLVWGIYNTEGALQQTFICNDDTTVINVESDEIELPDDAQIGIVHPSQLQPELLKQWQHFLYKQSIEQVFPQLDRKLPNLENIDLSKSILYQFVDKHMATGSTRSTLEKSGWHKGPTGDGGYLSSMNLSYQEKHLEAVLEVEGIGAGFGWGGDEKLGRLYVIDTSKIKSKWMMYAKDETDEKLVPFNKLPQIFVNEMLAAIQSIKPAEQVAS